MFEENTLTATELSPAHSLICFSHLRWDFVFQRPQHLMTRFARDRRVMYVEEPVPTSGTSFMQIRSTPPGVEVAVPHINSSLDEKAAADALRDMIDQALAEQSIIEPVVWYYTPMYFPYAQHLKAEMTVYDCMDELSAFRGAPPEMIHAEQRLMDRADIVFTGGHSLFEAKRTKHPRVFSFPSSVDVQHFAQARQRLDDPPDQSTIPHPRIGHYAVLDERLDTELLGAIADLRPDWQFILLGPIVKIDPADLPQRANIHYLGSKTYDALPAYMSGWDLAFMPFAQNASTRFISPTKTPEYLAAGLGVISTPIADVVRTYAPTGLVKIIETAPDFVDAAAALLGSEEGRSERLAQTDTLLATMSWDKTWSEMKGLIDDKHH